MKREFPDSPTLDELECLITWPKGSVGEREEREVIGCLLALCRLHGFGRIPQLASEIEEIWSDPNKAESYQKRKDEHLTIMREARCAQET